MLLKGSTVLSCLLPARLGFGPHPRPDAPPRPCDREKHAKDHRHPARPVSHGRFSEPELDPFRGNAPPLCHTTDPPDLSRAWTDAVPSTPLSPPPDGGIGESPGPPNRSPGPPGRLKRSSCTTFFTFSSKRRSIHGVPIVHIPHLQQDLLVPPHSVPGRWAPDSDQTRVHLINPSSLPSPLQTDDEEYYYSYYTSLSSAIPSPSTQTHPGPAVFSTSSKRLSPQQQDLAGIPDLGSQYSSPAGSTSHTHLHHPYAYSTPLSSNGYSKTVDVTPPLRHATSQPLQHSPRGSPSDIRTGLARGSIPPSQHGHEISKISSDLSQPRLKTSISTPNLASGAAPVRSRSVLRKKPPKCRDQERWLSVETWWDALLSPSPRFKVKQAPRLHTATGRNNPDPVNKPVHGQPESNSRVAFPSVPALRPRAVSTTSATASVRPTHQVLTRSRSTADLPGEPSTSATPHTGFEPALETLVDESILSSDHALCSEVELSLPDPVLSLAQVLDEGEAFEQQRAQWKEQASKSLGNRHTRSFSRARSKSLGARRSQSHHTLESNKSQLNLEFLAARTLLGSQSTMPTVHVSKPSDSLSHSKAYSHSHSQSAHSYSHTSHSRAYSHSHSHSLTTSNSSKSSRNLPPRGHSRSESWGKTALLKAGSLCGICQDESFSASAEEKVLSLSRVDVQGTIRVGNYSNAAGTLDAAKVAPSSSVPGGEGEVGIAITSSPVEGYFDLKVPGHPYVSGPRHREGERESRWSSKYTYKSSEYAGPHPSVIDSNLPQLDAASDVSLRHRLPPRAAIHPPIAPIAHPYRSAAAQPEQIEDKGRDGTALTVTKSREAAELGTEHTFYPHLSLSHADFERYGVGEALVYASRDQPKEVPEAQSVNVDSEPSPLPPPEEQSSICETAVLQSEESSSVVNSPPSLTNSTIQMVVSALDNPDELEEFHDLFYKPHPSPRDQGHGPSVTMNQVPTDVHGSASSSPLTHLVRKLSEACTQRPSQTPSDPVHPEENGSQFNRLNESVSKFVFMDLARTSSSHLPLESSSQLDLPIRKGSESTAQPVMVIPEDVDSSYTTSILGSPSEAYENDTFGHPIRQGQFEAAIAPSPIRSTVRTSTHLSIQENEGGGDEGSFLSPAIQRQGLSLAADAVRSSYLTTSDLSRISALSDFPLPPTARPEQSDQMSILQAYFVATPSPESQNRSQREDETEVGHEDRHTVADGGGDEEPSGDVDETLRVLRATARVTSFESYGSTFGGSDDMDFITQLHQAQS